jgi:hypothetical protein
MRTPLKLLVTVAAFGAFYAGAFVIMQGAKEFEKRGETALFTNKTEAAAIANAERYESQSQDAPAAPSVWK